MQRILTHHLPKDISLERGIQVTDQRVQRLRSLSGLTAAEKELVAYWVARGVPANHLSSFRVMWERHCGGER
ncbi:hypothetical protein [Leptolyngbya ohadii]|uniref:hypothetical protein n=1 Tax=Leptolyngbya ohadii TaxID=1962290 RepID=UPI00117A717B|nr:hypothetical protein [Leptolyngbya ohadii]